MKRLIDRVLFIWAKKYWIDCEDCKMLVKPHKWNEHLMAFHGLLEFMKHAQRKDNE